MNSKLLTQRTLGAGTTAGLAMVALMAASQANAQTVPTAAPAGAAPFMFHSWISALNAPLPNSVLLAEQGIGATIPASEVDLNAYGFLYTYQTGGATTTATNAFFQSLGTNGRSCATCHQPASGMSVSLPDIVARYVLTGPKDPIFAPVDGAVCPNQVPAANTKASYLGKRLGAGSSLAKAYSLLLTRGVFRIFLPLPTTADFTISVVTDPTTCNLTAAYDSVTTTDPVTLLPVVTPMISVYRRPLISTNLKFKTIGIDNNFPFIIGQSDPLDPTQALTIDGVSTDSGYNLPENGNIMWDGREPTLESQALDATLGHAQAIAPGPTVAQVDQMVAFETQIFSAQGYRLVSGDLTSQSGATGGPTNLSLVSPGQLAALGVVPGANGIHAYDSFSSVTGTTLAALQEESISRGEVIFNTRSFLVNNVRGLNDIPAVGNGTPNANGIGGSGAPGTCTLCHNQVGDGADAFPLAQHDLGISGDLSAFGGNAPASDLPIFKITCNAGATLNPFTQATTILTNDPGKALITGKCADVGRVTVPQLRGLASHRPYFHDGSATSLLAVVKFYEKRFVFATPLTTQDETDLVNFMASL